MFGFKTAHLKKPVGFIGCAFVNMSHNEGQGDPVGRHLEGQGDWEGIRMMMILLTYITDADAPLNKTRMVVTSVLNLG